MELERSLGEGSGLSDLQWAYPTWIFVRLISISPFQFVLCQGNKICWYDALVFTEPVQIYQHV